MRKKEIEKMFNQKIDSELWYRAKEYLKEKPTIKENFVFKNDPDGKYNYLTGYIIVKEVLKYRFTIVWIERMNKYLSTDYEILTCRCSCDSYVNEKNICVHLLAFLINIKIAGITEESSMEKFSEEEKLEQEKFYKKIINSEGSGKGEIGFNVRVKPVENRDYFLFVLSNFYVYTQENFIKYIKIEELFNGRGVPFYKTTYGSYQTIKFTEETKKFIDFISGIGKLKKSRDYINKKTGEITIPEVLLEKAVIFIKNMSKNYSKDIFFPTETHISTRKEFYILQFRGFLKIIPVGEHYAAVKEEMGNKTAIFYLGNEKIEKIKYLADFERAEKKLKLSADSVALKEILESLEEISTVSVGESLKRQIIVPKKMSVELKVKESYTGKLWIIPQFIYDGNSNEICRKRIVLKNINQERKILNELEEKLYFYGFERINDMFCIGSEEEKIYEFMTKHIEKIKELYTVIKEDDLENKEYRKLVPQLEIIFKENILIKFSIPGIDNREIPYILKNILRKKKYHYLSAKGMYDICSVELLEFEELLTGLNVQVSEIREGIVEREKSYFPFIKKTLTSMQVRKEILEIAKKINPRIPRLDPVFKILRPYQRKGANSLIRFRTENLNGVLADDTGLGKKIQLITYLYVYKKQKQNLILTFSFLMRYWENEIKKYMPSRKVKIVTGTLEERMKIIDKSKVGDILIGSYTTFAADFSRYKYIKFANIIFDEALYVKNRDMLLENSLKLKGESRFCLTGGFSWDDLYNIHYLFGLIKPGYLGSRRFFEERYIKVKDEEKNERKDMFLSLVNPYIIHRKKVRVENELPALTVKNLIIDMDQNKEYRKLYIKYLRKLNKIIIENDDIKTISRKRVFTILKRLAQICSHPKICKKDFYFRTEKIQATELFLKKCSDENLKTIVVTQYDAVLKLFRERFSRKWRSEFLDLKTEITEREYIYSMFNDEKDLIIFASRIDFKELSIADYDVIIYYDPPWKERLEDRIHNDKFGKNILEINLLLRGTLEEKILKEKFLKNSSIVMEIVNSLEGKDYVRDDIMALLHV